MSLGQCSTVLNPPTMVLLLRLGLHCVASGHPCTRLLSGSVTHSESSRKIPKRGNLIVHIFFFFFLLQLLSIFLIYFLYNGRHRAKWFSFIYVTYIYIYLYIYIYIYFFFRVLFLINVNSNDELRGLILSALPWAQHCVPSTVLSIFFGLVKWINKAPTFLV